MMYFDMRPGARKLAAALTGLAAAATMASLAVPPAGAEQAGQGTALAAQAGLHARPLPRRDVGGTRLAGRGLIVSYPPRHAVPLPGVPASAYVIADAGTGQVLAARDPHGLYPPASTLKVLTAITMLPRLRAGAWLTATRLAASVEPVVVGLIPGHRYQVADLFRALLMISANDAAVALAQASGSVSKGIALMNAEARRLQAYDVVARQPNGLPASGQVESAYDEALIARQALSMPAFMKYDSTLAARFPVTRRSVITLVNQNRLLTDYQGGIGGKIGWTIAAEATYVGLARRHGVTLIVTILHCTALQEITAAERLLDWGFAMDHKVRPVGALVPPLQPAAGSRRTSTAGPRKAASTRQAQPGSTSAHPAQPRGTGTHTAGPRSARARAAGPGHDPPGRAGLSASGLAAGAGIAAAAVLGIGGLARSRRRPASPGRHRSGLGCLS